MDPLQFFKCLADETRLRCLMLIESEQELCVCELTAALDEVQPKVSRHLAQLRKCKLLVDRKQGQWVYYRINPDLPAWALLVLRQTFEANLGFVEGNVKRLNRMAGRPDRAAICC
jgi:ArsR family transcriptional regulator